MHMKHINKINVGTKVKMIKIKHITLFANSEPINVNIKALVVRFKALCMATGGSWVRHTQLTFIVSVSRWMFS